MRSARLPSGEDVPALGLGTWRMGEDHRERADEIAALRAGLDHGITLIDTAEMYGSGAAEEIVREALQGRRDGIFIVSKVYPHNASRRGAIEACERSLERLGTDRIDLYLLHWPGSIPLHETVDAFQTLQSDGKIRHWGVSNFGVSDMAELKTVTGGGSCASNQVLYHLGERGIEWDLLPDCERDGIPIMAYSPLGQGAILRNRELGRIAQKHGVAPATVALAWVLRRPNMITIPKTAQAARVGEIVASLDLTLDDNDVDDLDNAFPPPRRSRPLAIN